MTRDLATPHVPPRRGSSLFGLAVERHSRCSDTVRCTLYAVLLDVCCTVRYTSDGFHYCGRPRLCMSQPTAGCATFSAAQGRRYGRHRRCPDVHTSVWRVASTSSCGPPRQALSSVYRPTVTSLTLELRGLMKGRPQNGVSLLRSVRGRTRHHQITEYIFIDTPLTHARVCRNAASTVRCGAARPQRRLTAPGSRAAAHFRSRKTRQSPAATTTRPRSVLLVLAVQILGWKPTEWPHVDFVRHHFSSFETIRGRGLINPRDILLATALDESTFCQDGFTSLSLTLQYPYIKTA
ncbi:hypothetical protein J6590_054541 [Homalodisca vitripennis]|nr:hypothetical protein J6590_054541 [Homalodisca vitripennis]